MLSLTKMYRPITAQPFDRSDGYREISTCEALKPYIRCFWTYESSPDMQPQLVIPDGSFPVTWIWCNDYAEYHIAANWWKSEFCINYMRFIRDFEG